MTNLEDLKLEFKEIFLNEVKYYGERIIHIDTVFDLMGQLNIEGIDIDDPKYIEIEGELEILIGDLGYEINSGCSDGGVVQYR